RVTALLAVPVCIAGLGVNVDRHGSPALTAVLALGLAAAARLLGTARRRELARAAGQALLVGSGAVLMVLGIGPRLGAYRTLTVLSGSMRPTFNPGDVIVVRPLPLHALRVGDVITYSVPIADRRVETHRIIRIVHGGANPTVITKGDANNAPDPWEATLQ